jgi:subtilisin family serine protease
MLLAAIALLSHSTADAQVPGESAVLSDRMIVRLHETGDVAPTPGDFIEAFENDPAHEGAEVVLLDAIAGRPIFLLGLSLPPGVDPMGIDLPERYPDFVDEGELLCECDAPEGGTGSTYVDGISLGPADYQNQYLRPMLGLDTAHTMNAGAGTVVAVLDTGVDVTHAALEGRIAPGGWNFVEGDADLRDVGNGQDADGDGAVDELVGHGTFVAALVSMVAPDAAIMPVRVLNGDGVGDAWTVAAGIYHAIDREVDVINLSLRSTLESEIVEGALEEAWERGIVAVSAAGNFNRSEPEEFPAMDDIVIGVAAVDDLDVKAPFSNFGDDLFISAPGGSLADATTADPLRSIISALPGGGYAIWEGTSMATPLVAGAAAMVLAIHPEWPANGDTVETVRDILAATAVDIDPLNPDVAGLLGVGRLDVAAAVTLAFELPGLGDGPRGIPRDGFFQAPAPPRGVTPEELTPSSAGER